MSKLLKRAKVKLHNALHNYHLIAEDDAYLDDCCYNLQQAMELALKFLVEIHGEPYIRNHDLRAQLNKLNMLGVEVPYYEEISRMAATLNSWEAESRYKDSFSALIDEIDAAAEYAKALISFAENKVKEIESGSGCITDF